MSGKTLLFALSLCSGLLAAASAQAASVAPLSDGEHFCQWHDGRLVSAAYRKAAETETLFSLSEMRGEKPDSVQQITFSPDERRVMLLGSDDQYYLYNIESNRCSLLSPEAEVSYPVFSPDGKNIAFVRGNDLWVKRLEYDTEFAVTKDGDRGEPNGLRTEDFRQAFGSAVTLAWLADGKHLCYVKGRQLMMYSMQYKWNRPVSLPAEADCITRIVPSPDPLKFGVMALNSRQTKLQLILVDAGTFIAKTVYKEEDGRFVAPAAAVNLLWAGAADNYFVLSQADGYTHIYQYNLLGKKLKQLTSGKFDVTALLGYDAAAGNVFFESTEAGPLKRGLYVVSVKSGKRTALTESLDRRSVSLSATWKYAALYDEARLAVCDLKGKVLSSSAPAESGAKPQLTEVAGFAGYVLSAAEPRGLLLVAADPNTWQSSDYRFLNEAGYVVACFQVSGAEGRGKDFLQAPYRKMCTVPAQDYAKLAYALSQRYNISPNRCFILGNGLQAAVALTAAALPDTPFAACVALRPETDLQSANPLLVERVMQTPGANSAYQTESPMGQCRQLKSRLLLVDYVSLEKADAPKLWRYLSQLQGSGRLFELQLYPGVCPCSVDDLSLPHLQQTLLEFFNR
ncbi:MAG: DPP IV N-terminal domain-containing protein [Paludibacteraceae bacterium]|nr:DPP IV N-terminal domain-containing protein [Paludibacteraceae bacterium]